MTRARFTARIVKIEPGPSRGSRRVTVCASGALGDTVFTLELDPREAGKLRAGLWEPKATPARKPAAERVLA